MPHFSAKLWAAIRAAEDTKLNPPAKVKALDAFEAKHKIVLPEAHREFLLQANGGVIDWVRMFCVGGKSPLEMGRVKREMRPFIDATSKHPVLPFANDWGGNYFCYDLRKPPSTKGYPVLHWNHEYAEEEETLPDVWSKTAPNFVAFIKYVIAPI